jgi:hypothetical protein
MMHHIQVGRVLRETLQTPYRDLVTRPTGRAVRTSIQAELGTEPAPLTCLDFSAVGLVDFSCADEVVAKLLLDPPAGTYLLLQGLSEEQLVAIEYVLDRQALAALVRDADTGRAWPVGRVGADLQTAFAHLQRLGPCSAAELAGHLGWAAAHTEDVLQGLARHRLVRIHDGCYAIPLVT